MAAVTYSNTDINRFWLQVLGDNALIILNILSPQSSAEIRDAKALADRFDALALRANQNPTPEQTAQLNREAFQAAQEIRKFFIHILDLMLTTNFHIDIKPAIINYFVNEAERYMDLLNAFMQNKTPASDLLKEEIFWLPAFSLQNRYIADKLGYFQIENREKARTLATVIDRYWDSSVELYGISRIGTEDFPMVREHHLVVIDVLNGYYRFLNNLITLKEERRQSGSMSLLYLDRSRRMLCRFLMQAAAFTDTTVPTCDPYAKRISIY
jgi:hypothetical protein